MCRAHQYVALKVCVSGYPSVRREKAAVARLRSLNTDSPFIQECLDEFSVERDTGAIHECFVMEPLSWSVSECSSLFSDKEGRWTMDHFRKAAREVLHSLKYLHEEAKIIHCGSLQFIALLIKSLVLTVPLGSQICERITS